MLFAGLVSVVFFLMRFEDGLRPLDDDDDFLVLGVIFAHFQLVETHRDSVEGQLVDWEAAGESRSSCRWLAILFSGGVPRALRLSRMREGLVGVASGFLNLQGRLGLIRRLGPIRLAVLVLFLPPILILSIILLLLACLSLHFTIMCRSLVQFGRQLPIF